MIDYRKIIDRLIDKLLDCQERIILGHIIDEQSFVSEL